MRRLLNVMPMILLAVSIPVFAVQSETPSPVFTHRIQVFRAEKGEPRMRAVLTARTAPSRTPHQVLGQGRTRPYQVAKPGEGSPKN